MRVRGRSMVPLFFSDDSLRVVRCAGSDVIRGDVAVMASDGGRLIAHVVEQSTPLVTASFLGARDAASMEVLGRVTGVRRGTRSVAIPRAVAPAVALLHRGLSSAPMHSLAQFTRTFLGSDVTAPLRARVFERARVDVLNADEVSAAAAFVADAMGANAAARFETAAAHGTTAAARVEKRFASVAVATADTIEFAHTDWLARGLGLERQVLAALPRVRSIAPGLGREWAIDV